MALDFENMSDNLAEIARSGIESAKSLFKSIQYIQNVDLSTILNKEGSIVFQNEFNVILRNSYEIIFTSGYSLRPMEDMFNQLSKYITENYSNINDYLSENNIQVDPTYALISSSIGINIYENNIRE